MEHKKAPILESVQYWCSIVSESCRVCTFKYSQLKVLSNKTSILDELEKIPLELYNLKERINNNDGTEWGNIITTGSPVYNI